MDAKMNNIRNLYDSLWDSYVAWEHYTPDVNPDWNEHRYAMYSCGPILGKYREQDAKLLEIIAADFTDNEILSIVIPFVECQKREYENKAELDIIESEKYKICAKELLLLENGQLNNWINSHFLPGLKFACPEIKEEHIRGLCFIEYGFRNYFLAKTSIYNPDKDNLLMIYTGIWGKGSQLRKYGLIEIDDNCELMSIDPPRFYDSKVDKTFYLKNISKELLEILINIRSFYDKLSVRASNAELHIFDGKYTLQTLSEAVEFGQIFSINDFSNIPLTKLYSKNYDDSLWIKVDESNITFEELCENEHNYGNAIITQVVHMEYLMNDHEAVITHIDHEYIFYDSLDYQKRKSEATVKGKEQMRLKSFKIDGGRIPINMICEREVNVPDKSFRKVQKVSETALLMIIILKSYFKHTELIDEYFQNVLS